MATFELYLPRLLRTEGGYVNHPADRGGPTKYGITLAALSAWQGRPAGVGQIQGLSAVAAGRIYKQLYWDKIRGDELPQPAAEQLADFAVHSGPARAIRQVQAAAGLEADGILGPKTMALLQSPQAALIIHDARAMFLIEVLADPSQAVFARGWANRLRELLVD